MKDRVGKELSIGNGVVYLVKEKNGGVLQTGFIVSITSRTVTILNDKSRETVKILPNMCIRLEKDKLWRYSVGLQMRELKLTGGWQDRKCMLCGRYFNEGDMGVLIVPTSDIRDRISRNLIVHSEELKKVQVECGSEEELINKLSKWKMPRVRVVYSEKELRIADAFQEASSACGFRDIKEVKNKGIIRCKKFGSSDLVELNIRTGRIRFDTRKKGQLLSGFAERQLIANIRNKMHEILGDGLHDDYDAMKEIAGVFDRVNNMMK